MNKRWSNILPHPKPYPKPEAQQPDDLEKNNMIDSHINEKRITAVNRLSDSAIALAVASALLNMF